MPEEFANDHDILITLVSEVRQARTEIKEIKDGTSSKLDDHEKRIQYLEKYKSAIQTTFTLYGVAIGAGFTVIMYLIFGKG